MILLEYWQGSLSFWAGSDCLPVHNFLPFIKQRVCVCVCVRASTGVSVHVHVGVYVQVRASWQWRSFAIITWIITVCYGLTATGTTVCSRNK